MTAPPDPDPPPADDRLLSERPAPPPRIPDDRVIAEVPAAFPGTGTRERTVATRQAHQPVTGR